MNVIRLDTQASYQANGKYVMDPGLQLKERHAELGSDCPGE